MKVRGGVAEKLEARQAEAFGLFARGITQAAVARTLGINKTLVGQWHRVWESNGGGVEKRGMEKRAEVESSSSGAINSQLAYALARLAGVYGLEQVGQALEQLRNLTRLMSPTTTQEVAMPPGIDMELVDDEAAEHLSNGAPPESVAVEA